jgi:hypothetical protein
VHGLPAELTTAERRVAPMLRHDVVPRTHTHCLSSRPLYPVGNPTLPTPRDAGYNHGQLSGETLFTEGFTMMRLAILGISRPDRFPKVASWARFDLIRGMCTPQSGL